MASQITADDSRLLFNALGANGLFSSVSGVTMVLASGSVADFLGLADSGLVLESGILLILFGAMLLCFYSRKRVHKASAIVISLLDFGWVTGSVAIVVAVPELLSAAGVATVIAIAVVVLALCDLQAYALWRIRRTEL